MSTVHNLYITGLVIGLPMAGYFAFRLWQLSQPSDDIGRVLEARRSVLAFLEVRRGFSVGIAVTGSLVAALLAVLIEGNGFKPLKPIPAGNNLGTAQAIRLPVGARQHGEIKSFIVRLEDVDDYGRVFVNNYLALTNEHPDAIFYTNENPEKKKSFSSVSVKRENPVGPERDVVSFLLPGLNTVVFEVENGIWGACHSRISLVVNNQVLEGFPTSIPATFSVEPDVRNRELFTRYQKAIAPNQAHPELVLSPSTNALCGRRFLTFELG